MEKNHDFETIQIGAPRILSMCLILKIVNSTHFCQIKSHILGKLKNFEYLHNYLYICQAVLSRFLILFLHSYFYTAGVVDCEKPFVQIVSAI